MIDTTISPEGLDPLSDQASDIELSRRFANGFIPDLGPMVMVVSGAGFQYSFALKPDFELGLSGIRSALHTLFRDCDLPPVPIPPGMEFTEGETKEFLLIGPDGELRKRPKTGFLRKVKDCDVFHISGQTKTPVQFNSADDRCVEVYKYRAYSRTLARDFEMASGIHRPPTIALEPACTALPGCMSQVLGGDRGGQSACFTEPAFTLLTRSTIRSGALI